MGFEPTIPISGYAHLANECLQPLGHVSVARDMPQFAQLWQAAKVDPAQAIGERSLLAPGL